ncbi:FecR family protein [Oceanicoccus sagamiensis]|uniref:FecR protein domain-containing protein n=1 Tax=Oceanicoccus sagamiensis TaxID=716816 RepID=A0A1X9N7Z7_9GAMM|nr:FecR domain-containing protein [Oceanicoccus sagamiensis]ARN73806.1 hypothetical protein BST96_06580 [Oceanicoccus sagamiensis]
MTTANHKPGGKVIEMPQGNALSDQAAGWIAALDADPVSDETLAAFRQWVNAAPEHAAEFERLAQRWQSLNQLTQLTVPSEQSSDAIHPAAPWFGRWQGGAVAMAAVVLVVITLFTGNTSQLYATGIGEQKTVVLSDNSRIQLNTNTRLKIDYSEQRRGIHLLQGEAYFEVAHNPGRPFEVYSGAGVVRAIGTAFSVYLNHQQIEVLVNEGVVEVDNIPTPQTAPAIEAPTVATKPLPERPRITAGSRATFAHHQPLQVAMESSVEVDKQLAWRSGTLVFRQEPLQALVDEVSRYTSTRIVITDNALRTLRVGVYLKWAIPTPCWMLWL